MNIKIFYQTILIITMVVSCSDDTHESVKSKKDIIQNQQKKTNIKTYNSVVGSIHDWQIIKSKHYLKLISDSIKISFINNLKDSIVLKIVDDIIPYWYGTPWEFYGTTEKPKQGSIACGYFVSTILKHAGYNVEKNKMAQQASELIIKSLVSEKYIKICSYLYQIKEFP